MKTEDIILIIGGLILLGGGLAAFTRPPPDEEPPEEPEPAPVVQVNLLYEYCKVKWGAKWGDPNYDQICDVNNDGIIGLADMNALLRMESEVE